MLHKERLILLGQPVTKQELLTAIKIWENETVPKDSNDISTSSSSAGNESDKTNAELISIHRISFASSDSEKTTSQTTLDEIKLNLI